LSSTEGNRDDDVKMRFDVELWIYLLTIKGWECMLASKPCCIHCIGVDKIEHTNN